MIRWYCIKIKYTNTHIYICIHMSWTWYKIMKDTQKQESIESRHQHKQKLRKHKMEHLFQPGKGTTPGFTEPSAHWPFGHLHRTCLHRRSEDKQQNFTAFSPQNMLISRDSRTQTSRWLIHLAKSNKPYMSRSPQSQFHPTFSTSGWGQTLWRFTMPPPQKKAVKLKGQEKNHITTILPILPVPCNNLGPGYSHPAGNFQSLIEDRCKMHDLGHWQVPYGHHIVLLGFSHASTMYLYVNNIMLLYDYIMI